MNSIFSAFRQSFAALLRFRMFLLVLLPPLVVFLILLFVLIFYWTPLVSGLAAIFSGFGIFQWLQNLTGVLELSHWVAVLFLILLFIPLSYLCAILLTSLLAMPFVLAWVGGTDFKDLEKRRGGTVLGSVWNALSASLLFLVAFLVTLPLWLIPGLQILLPLALSAWLNKKVFMYDVLQDYATREERQKIQQLHRGSLYGMGLFLGGLSYIPLALFFVPVVSALSYTYYGLNALQELRKRQS